jgi:hypothetical protein
MTPPICHPDKPHEAHGLCKACYEHSRIFDNPEKLEKKHLRDRKLAALKRMSQPPRSPKQRKTFPSCHPDRPLYAKDLCNSCYTKQWLDAVPSRRLRRAASISRWRVKNKEHLKEYDKAHNRSRQRRSKEEQRKYYHKYLYGLTEQQYTAMLSSQQGLCAICGNPPKNNKVLTVDHNHATKQVRALLCNKCNRYLWALETTEWNEKATAYLNYWSARE